MKITIKRNTVKTVHYSKKKGKKQWKIVNNWGKLLGLSGEGRREGVEEEKGGSQWVAWELIMWS